VRIALIQPRFIQESASSNLQQLIAGIHEAATCKPAPDLLILPGNCDTGGSLEGPENPKYRPNVTECLSWEARDWGVYIAAGMTKADQHGASGTLLWDPDGDVMGATREPTANDRVDTPAKPAPAILDTPIGCIVLTESARHFLELEDDLGGALAVIPLPHGLIGAEKDAEWQAIRALHDNPDQRRDLICCLICASGVSWPVTSGIIGPQGTIATATSLNEGIVHATVDVLVRPVEAVMSEHDDDADSSS
jgi:predicted amidohydrolase